MNNANNTASFRSFVFGQLVEILPNAQGKDDGYGHREGWIAKRYPGGARVGVEMKDTGKVVAFTAERIKR